MEFRRVLFRSSELSLCFDPSSDLVGDFAEGEALLEGADPSEACKATLNFCEQFEVAGQKTTAFIAELAKHDLLMDGEVTIQRGGAERSEERRVGNGGVRKCRSRWSG